MIPPRIAQRARETCEAEQRQVGIGFPPGVTGEPHHGPTPPFYDCTCDLIAAALLAQDREATERACWAVCDLYVPDDYGWGGAMEAAEQAIRAAQEEGK